MDYYAVSMAVMMIFMSHMIMGSTALKDEERIFTLQRLYLSPVGKVSWFSESSSYGPPPQEMR